MAERILLVEDDPDLAEALQDTLELSGFEVVRADSAESAIVVLKKQLFQLVISDVNMPGMDGHELLNYICKHHVALPVVLMTAFGQVEKAVEAMQQGACDYLMKPFEAEQLIGTVNKYACGLSLGKRETVARSTSSHQLLQLAARVAVTNSTVLITGESGTGKEVLARFIHEKSPRAKRPFIAINCAAIPENMLESILFGYEKGAFTGAVNASAGKFEQANGGTLLLDEVTEMPLALQAKLLRVLQESEVERIGGKSTIKLDVRVLATSNRSLDEYVAQGDFREDLYYRLNVFPLQWLPLRDRVEDIMPLAQQLLVQHSAKMGLKGVTFTPEAVHVLEAHSWPGNVRELDNAVQRALIIQQTGSISASDLHLSGPITMQAMSSAAAEPVAERPSEQVVLPQSAKVPLDETLGSDLRQREFEIILEVMRETKGSRKEAAIRLDVSPRTLRYKLAKMREAGIDLDAELGR
ncbi:MAG: sigma-54-dependent transcriptional regulator [Pseudomonadales bacterium]